MTKPNTSHVCILLDRSGSMGGVRDATIEGFNAFITKQKDAKDIQTRVTFIQFDDRYELQFASLALSNVPLLTHDMYIPRGYTALNDAIARSIRELGEHLAAISEQDRPAKVIFVIQTDGLENASREATGEQVLEMIKHQRDKYSWEFVFLGANIDAISAAASLGINAANALQYNANAVSTRKAFSAVGHAVRSYSLGTTGDAIFNNSVVRGAVMSANVGEDELEKLLEEEEKRLGPV